MGIFEKWTLRVLLTILAFGLGLGFVWLAWRTLLLFLFAILFAYLLEPLATLLQENLGWKRRTAVAAIYVGLVAGVGVFGIALGPRLEHQADRLAQLAPHWTENLATGKIAQQVGSERGWSEQTQYRARMLLAEHRGLINQMQARALSDLTAVAGYALWIALVPILAAFFLVSGRDFAEAMLDQISRRSQRQLLGQVMEDLHLVLARYIRAQIVLTGLAWAVYLLAFEVMRLPYAVALASLAGVLEFIPVVGPLSAFVVVTGTAFLVDYPHLAMLVLFLGGWRVVQDYYNSPRIMGGHIELHPLAVLFGVFAGAEIGGVIGVYLSVPAIAALRVVWRRWRAFQSAQQFGADAGAPQPRIVTPDEMAS